MSPPVRPAFPAAARTLRGDLLAAFATLALAAAGCSDSDPLPSSADAQAVLDAQVVPDAGAVVDAGDGADATDDASDVLPADAACMVELSDPLTEGANHVATCSPVQWGTNPPSSGMHYPSWPVFRAYDKPVPWGFLVHGLEHGAVVLAYNCPGGCAADVAAAKAVMAATTPRSCGSPPVILTPDPTLSVRFSASAWGHILRASCFDKAAFAAFITAHRDRGPELFATDCGAVDLEADGWCP
jgi:hypothetical protein